MSGVICPSCRSTSVRRIGPIPQGHTFAGRLLDAPIPGGDLIRCDDCRMGFKWPQTSKAELDRLYQLAAPGVWNDEPERRRDWVMAREELLGSAPGALLDVGCFDGAFHRFVRESSDAWQMFGVEVNATAANVARGGGVTIVGADAERLEGDRKYAAVVAFDLIEHLSDPATLLGRMADLLEPGGILIVSTGNLDAPTWRLMGGGYWYSALVEHISFLSPSWCEHAALRLGLSLERVVLFSHAGRRRLLERSMEFGKNMVYRFAPSVFRALRKLGMGGVDVSGNDALANAAPTWITAQDHFLAVFRKKES
jgi:SAM-dependent methyltransferase